MLKLHRDLLAWLPAYDDGPAARPAADRPARLAWENRLVSKDRQTGSLLSVNVGLPQDIPWHGQVVHTAVWKRPVEGQRQVRRLNIDGDGQGDLNGHGGEQRAVFVYQIESYQYWREQLSRDDFEYGQFGENFTVRGLPDDQVCIGDRYQIGEALFEVIPAEGYLLPRWHPDE